jgi:anaerobic magnesium-protoporphyrin IX monomethyl ester cyclase
MRILLVNIPHPAIGSRIPREQLPPLGLLWVGGPLIDAGHVVKLIDGEFGPMPLAQIVNQALEFKPDAVMFGHSGSSSGHPIISKTAQMMKAAMPDVRIVYGGVHPTYHWREILAEESYVDAIVRGEGEVIVQHLVAAFETDTPLDAILGIAFHKDQKPFATAAAPVIADLDAQRIGWELIDHTRYSYWGGKRAVVIQFSRGCPHLCNYCGQRGFWTRWRHRDPQKLAAEIAHLHRKHGVEVFNFADENPSAGRKPWLDFLRALIAQNIEVTLVGSTRADDIVRDKEELHLYKKAGFERFLMGMETTDEATLALIKKGGTISADREAIKLLRQHKILSMVTWVAGFEDQTDADFVTGLKQLLSYDADQIQALYVTPHRWTPFFTLAKDRQVVQPDKTKWDYKHQVLSMTRMPPWRVFLWVKAIEFMVQARPKAILRLLYHPDPKIHHAIRWYYRMGRRVWFHEIFGFFFKDKTKETGENLAQFAGAPQDHEEEASSPKRIVIRRPVAGTPLNLLPRATQTSAPSAQPHLGPAPLRQQN